MLMVKSAELNNPGVFLKKDGQDILIINQNESAEKIGKLIKQFTQNNKPVPARTDTD